MTKHFVLKGDICYAHNKDMLNTQENGYLVCEDGISCGVFSQLPEQYAHYTHYDYSGRLIIPGLVDLHMHAPQYAYRGLGMDLELLDWLNRRTFPEEAKYADINYAEKAYEMVVQDLIKGPNTRACLFATIHLPATRLLMDMLEQSGLICYVGKVNMDRNCSIDLKETAEQSLSVTNQWLKETIGRYRNILPILTPRFIPSCSDTLMHGLALLQQTFRLPVQSHLSENKSEIAWVQELCPKSCFYGDAYDHFELFGGNAKTIMAHCVWSNEAEQELICSKGVYVAHCPQSNINLASGIAPIRHFLNKGIRIGLGSDVAGGCHSSIFRAISDAIQMSKLYWRLVDHHALPLTVQEAFYLGTMGGGAFFGQVGSFAPGYEFDALVLDDAAIKTPLALPIEDRLARIIYLADDRQVEAKFVRGKLIFSQ